MASTAADLLRLLRRFGLARDRLHALVGRDAGIARADIDALEHLSASGGLTPGQLGDRLGLTSGSVTALVDRLEHQGFVERTPHDRDRRSTVVQRAGSARRAEEEFAGLEAGLRRAAERLTAAQRETVAAFLQAVVDVAEAEADLRRR